MATSAKWWETTSIYQIYPRSFYDSNGDGIGDLPGVIQKLDYVQSLGFETVWLSPFFTSPQQDFGYDVADFLDVDPDYGTLADAERLIQEVHRREMRVLFDLVLNHTSDQHAWFRESRSSRDNPKRDWYIWRDGRGNGPPNNWKSIPGGDGWTYEAETDQWYWHSFLTFQPDLNWRNPAVKAAMFDTLRFWLARGVDGFRLDIFHAIYEDAEFQDNPFDWTYIPDEKRAGYFQAWAHTINQPETIALAREVRAVLDEFQPSRAALGEIFAEDDDLRAYMGGLARDGMNLIFQWELLDLEPTVEFLQGVIRRWEQEFPPPYQPVVVFGNHDRQRLRSKLKGDERLAGLMALFQFTTRGVPVTYYGEEIGMQEVRIPNGHALDPLGQRYAWVPAWLEKGLNLYLNRDGCRTPMIWDHLPQAGFTNGGVEPWLPVHPELGKYNVAEQDEDPESLLNLYRALLRLRSGSTAIKHGGLTLIEVEPGVLAYRREFKGERLNVYINLNRHSVYQQVDGADRLALRVDEVTLNHGELFLPPQSGAVVRL